MCSVNTLIGHAFDRLVRAEIYRAEVVGVIIVGTRRPQHQGARVERAGVSHQLGWFQSKIQFELVLIRGWEGGS